MTRITVINPNTSTELTEAITAAAQSVSGDGVKVAGVNPPVGVPSVENPIGSLPVRAKRPPAP